MAAEYEGLKHQQARGFSDCTEQPGLFVPNSHVWSLAKQPLEQHARSGVVTVACHGQRRLVLGLSVARDQHAQRPGCFRPHSAHALRSSNDGANGCCGATRRYGASHAPEH
jgi:hypothetical protein